MLSTSFPNSCTDQQLGIDQQSNGFCDIYTVLFVMVYLLKQTHHFLFMPFPLLIEPKMYTSAYIVFHGANAISWSSKKQKTVACSSTEAEYRVVASIASEITWIQFILHEIGVNTTRPPTIYCDDSSATYLCGNPVFHSRMKHIANTFHLVSDKVRNNSVRVSHVSSYDQLTMRLDDLRNKIDVHSYTPS